MDQKEEAWLVLSRELGEALLDAERTFLDVVDNYHAPRLKRDEALRAYLEAWSRLARAHRLLAHLLLE